jgi:hypothetical protein
LACNPWLVLTPTAADIGVIANINQKGLKPPTSHRFTVAEAENCLVLSHNLPGPTLSSALADIVKFLKANPTEVCKALLV